MLAPQDQYEFTPYEPAVEVLDSSLGAVLIIDRYQPHAELLESILGSLSCSVTRTDTPGKALFAIQQMAFDLIVLDIGYPKAAETIEVLKQRTRAALIVISDANPTISVAEALDVGADDYVLSPVRPAELRARARAVTRRTRGLGRPFER